MIAVLGIDIRLIRHVLRPSNTYTCLHPLTRQFFITDRNQHCHSLHRHVDLPGTKAIPRSRNLSMVLHYDSFLTGSWSEARKELCPACDTAGA